MHNHIQRADNHQRCRHLFSFLSQHILKSVHTLYVGLTPTICTAWIPHFNNLVSFVSTSVLFMTFSLSRLSSPLFLLYPFLLLMSLCLKGPLLYSNQIHQYIIVLSYIQNMSLSVWLKMTNRSPIVASHNPLCFSPVSKVLILCLLLQMKIRSHSPHPFERYLVKNRDAPIANFGADTIADPIEWAIYGDLPFKTQLMGLIHWRFHKQQPT